jgi:hypothetical protein
VKKSALWCTDRSTSAHTLVVTHLPLPRLRERYDDCVAELSRLEHHGRDVPRAAADCLAARDHLITAATAQMYAGAPLSPTLAAVRGPARCPGTPPPTPPTGWTAAALRDLYDDLVHTGRCACAAGEALLDAALEELARGDDVDVVLSAVAGRP